MARGKQISFPPLQTHKKNFEYAMILISILCIVIVVLIAKATDWGINDAAVAAGPVLAGAEMRSGRESDRLQGSRAIGIRASADPDLAHY